MGAASFFTVGKGEDAKEAFASARDQEAYEHGHGGYTGTLAEKHEFVMIDVPPHVYDATEYAEKLVSDGDERINDKWGPAGCIELSPSTFLFFGNASS